ncbi:uncharacterized protein LOC120355135 [Nilaparvata lugens]|uniref:uncharacterized protein LOC120355135 n=1 Tax=Nilaparvata lugens TaxID=108931 RepID=UPI00193D03EC|nr:uncharacterized protein LOC120355135 [Nilaparvata lugens]
MLTAKHGVKAKLPYLLDGGSDMSQKILQVLGKDDYNERKAAELCAASSAAAAAASAPAPAPLDPASPGGEIVIRDSPIHCLAPAPTWAPQRAVLTTLSNSIRQKQAKRKLTFEEPEVSGDEEEHVLTQSKKRVPEENSSLVPLMEEVRRREVEEEEEAENEMESESFLKLLNSRMEKPWTPLRELEEGLPYPICDVREASNQHGCRIVVKIRVPGVRTTDVYLPERFARILSEKDI